MKIEYYLKSNYGRIDKYLADQKLNRLVNMLTGRVTVDDRDLELLAELLQAECLQVINPNY